MGKNQKKYPIKSMAYDMFSFKQQMFVSDVK